MSEPVHEVSLEDLEKWARSDDALSMKLLIEGKSEESESVRRRGVFIQGVMERLRERRGTRSPALNFVDSEKGLNDWNALAFTRTQWELLLCAVRQSRGLLENIYGEVDLRYVMKWLRSVTNEDV